MDRKGIALDQLGKILLGLAVLLAVLMLMFFFREPAQNMITSIIDAMRFS